jgi:hypothetical protein
MSYRERLNAFTRSSRHRRLRFLVAIFATLHLIGNIAAIIHGRSIGLYAEPSLFRVTVAYWVGFTIVFWIVVYVACRFAMPLFGRKQ